MSKSQITEPIHTAKSFRTTGASRRGFLLAGSLGAGALLTRMFNGRYPGLREGMAAQGTPVVARRKGTIAQIVQGCVDALGGITSFVPQGSRVAVKVNGSWNNASANTSPEVVKEVVALIMSAGPSSVTVYDHVIQTAGWRDIADAARSAGADAVALGGGKAQYVLETIPGVGLKSARVARILEQGDVLINVPVLKTHSSGQVTIGLKNHLGTVQDRGAVHDGGGLGLHQGIADANLSPSIRNKHRLTICDAISPMITGGPSSGRHAEYNGILAGVDPVATDYVGTQIIRRYNPQVPENPIQIEKASALGLGTNDPTQIRFDEEDQSMPIHEPDLLIMAGLAALGLVAGSRASRLP